MLAGVVAVGLVPSCGEGGRDGGRGAGSAAGDAGTGPGAQSDGATQADDGPGGTTTPDGSSLAPDGGATGGASCLGSSFLSALGKSRLIVGGSMASATAAAAPFDLQYVYLSGGFSDGTGPCASCATACTTNGTTCANSGPGCAWWGCWQSDQDPPGAYERNFASSCAKEKPGQVPMITYYQILQASGVQEGAPEVTQAATNATFMARYFADWRFLLKQIGQGTALLHIEPDFWGYARQANASPHALTAAVASANSTDCGSMENSIAGMGQCLVAMVRKYAPHALVGLHASAWDINASGDAQKTAAFLAACGESTADFVVVETSDRDAGYYQSIGKNTWWDATNAKLPDFHQDFAWVKTLTEALNKPALWWQTPLGNMSQTNTNDHWQDNRVDYFFGHMDELAAAHGVGAAFGAGANGQTTPESDGGNFIAKAKAYYQAGGQQLCP